MRTSPPPVPIQDPRGPVLPNSRRRSILKLTQLAKVNTMDASTHEAMAMWGANAITSFSIYLTFTFAYLTAAYLAGTKLTVYQVFVLSTLYTIGALISLASVISNLELYAVLFNQDDLLRSSITFTPEFWIYTITPLFMVGIGVSLSFMWYVRHPHAE